MNTGRTVFSQLMVFLPIYEFYKCVRRYRGDYKIKSFSCLDQFLCMAFAQLTYRESLRAFFVTRSKSNLQFHRLYSHPVDKSTDLKCDQTIVLTGIKPSKYYPEKLRRIRYFDSETNKSLTFRNHLRQSIPGKMKIICDSLLYLFNLLSGKVTTAIYTYSG